MIRMWNRKSDFRIPLWKVVLVAAWALCCFSASFTWARGAPQLVFEAEGKSSVKNENYVKSRALAEDYAFQNAFVLALQDILGERTYHRKRGVLKKMLKQPKKYINRYRYLEVYDSEVEQFSRVKLEVVFFPEAINRELSRLGILSSLVKPNTALVLINERSLSAEVPPDFWDYVPISEVVMLQKFLAAGVNVTTREILSELIDESEVYEAIQGDLDAAVDIGLKAKVDIVIVGTAVTTRLGEKPPEDPDAELGEKKPSGPVTVQANLTLRAVSTIQSTVIAARSDFALVEAEEEFEGELQAFEVVGKKMAGFFLETMKRFWEPKPQPEAGIVPEGLVPESPVPSASSPPPSDSTPSMMEDL